MSINLKEYFGDYKSKNVEILNKYISMLDEKVSKYYNFGKPFFKGDHCLNYKEYLQKCKLNYNSLTAEETFEYISPLYQNLPNWNNPGTMINVIPPVNLVSVASMSFSELYFRFSELGLETKLWSIHFWRKGYKSICYKDSINKSLSRNSEFRV